MCPPDGLSHHLCLSPFVSRSPETSPLRPDSAYFTTSASKAKFLTQYGRDVSADQSLKNVHNVEEVKRQKVGSLG